MVYNITGHQVWDILTGPVKPNNRETLIMREREGEGREKDRPMEREIDRQRGGDNAAAGKEMVEKVRLREREREGEGEGEGEGERIARRKRGGRGNWKGRKLQASIGAKTVTLV